MSINFHGGGQRRRFFEGWYFKHQGRDSSLALIPSYHLDEAGAAAASLQVITDEFSHSLSFPASSFAASRNSLQIKLADSYFSDAGISMRVETPSLSLIGNLTYTPLTPPKTDVMGPFRFLPFMQCNHGVVSLAHRLSGSLTVNGKLYDFNGGLGYIEKDWGSSFPSTYLWTQVSWPEKASAAPAAKDRRDAAPQSAAEACCVMISAARVPILGAAFNGCIASILYHGKQYRLATYLGAKLDRYTDCGVALSQGGSRLEARLLRQKALPLQAPQRGGMGRTIHESLSATVRYRFRTNDRLLFDITSDRACFETSGFETADAPAQRGPDTGLSSRPQSRLPN